MIKIPHSDSLKSFLLLTKKGMYHMVYFLFLKLF